MSRKTKTFEAGEFVFDMDGVKNQPTDWEDIGSGLLLFATERQGFLYFLLLLSFQRGWLIWSKRLRAR